jgi:hypothetical protein
MTTAADQFNDIPSPTDLQQFVCLANNVFELLETAEESFDEAARQQKERPAVRGRRCGRYRVLLNRDTYPI